MCPITFCTGPNPPMNIDQSLILMNINIFTVIALLVFLLVKSFNIRSKEKSILYDEQYDDIRENVMDHDEEGAGRSHDMSHVASHHMTHHKTH